MEEIGQKVTHHLQLVPSGGSLPNIGVDASQSGVHSNAGAFTLPSRNPVPPVIMNTPTREELDAKNEALEARMDARIASIEAKIDNFVTVLAERSRASDERMGRLETVINETNSYIRNLKSTIITTAIGAVLAIILGVAAFNATVLSNMVASFESGKNTAATQAEVKRQTEETSALLRKIQAQVERPTPPKK